jgi:hypothetical protein
VCPASRPSGQHPRVGPRLRPRRTGAPARPPTISRAQQPLTPPAPSRCRLRKDTIGYRPNEYPEKDVQQGTVEGLVAQQGFIPADLVKGEVEWFYQCVVLASPPFARRPCQRACSKRTGPADRTFPPPCRHLGIDATYFQREEPAIIAEHIMALYVRERARPLPPGRVLPPGMATVADRSPSRRYGAKILAFTKHSADKLQIDLERIQPEAEGKKEGQSLLAPDLRPAPARACVRQAGV